MPLVYRGSLPQEFVDITSAMMLTTPEPQYFYYNLWLQALNAQINLEQALSSGLDLIGRASLGGNGAPLGSFEQNQLMLELDPVMKDFVRVVNEKNGKPGHITRINRSIFQNSTYTELSREIGANATISTTPIGVKNSSVPITLRRFGGPYDQTNSRIAPIGVDAFDTMLAMHVTAQRVGMDLKRDFMKFVETCFATLLDNATNVVRPTGFSADDDSTSQGDAPFDTDVMERTALALDEANVPVGPDGRRTMVLHSRQIYQLGRDPRLTRLAQSNDSINPLTSKAYKFCTAHFNVFQSTSLRTSTNSSSKTIYKGHAFGPGMLAAVNGMLPEIRQSTDDNYGETGKVIWLAYQGWGAMDASFGAVIKTS